MRLIDAEVLIRRAIGRYKEMMGTDIGHGMGVIASMITDAPTIDAVPVVRCKDCKHLQYGYQCYNPLGIMLTNDGDAYVIVSENDFCSYGERKDGEVK